jgi:hypothetical protein
MARISFSGVAAALALVDDPKANEKVSNIHELHLARDMIRPRNWGIVEAPEDLLLISYVEGIPVAWIPRREIIQALALATNSDARVQLLEKYDGEILEDCNAALEECNDPWISSDRTLASKALKAYQNGHFEAAMALAVSLAEPLAVWVSTERSMPFDADDIKQVRTESKSLYGKSKYLWADKKWFASQGFDVSKLKFKERVLAAPVPSFFAEFHVDAGLPPLRNLSRHVVAHLPTVDHFTRHNSRLALMLVCSILREQESYCAELRAMADTAEEG